MIVKEVREKRSMDRTIQIFKRNKGNEFYWQQLIEHIAQAQHWCLAKEQCLATGQEKGFEMAAENEQKFLECIDRIDKEVGIDKKELKRRIDKALGR
ncbi:MAG: hypothetical protein KAI59_02555 [Planctomycetes bacterium]|nr:hypothetical protein [Planctomycetota bacterium]